jgi:hypothetical protein
MKKLFFALFIALFHISLAAAQTPLPRTLTGVWQTMYNASLGTQLAFKPNGSVVKSTLLAKQFKYMVSGNRLTLALKDTISAKKYGSQSYTFQVNGSKLSLKDSTGKTRVWQRVGKAELAADASPLVGKWQLGEVTKGKAALSTQEFFQTGIVAFRAVLDDDKAAYTLNADTLRIKAKDGAVQTSRIEVSDSLLVIKAINGRGRIVFQPVK